jgi:regulator of protease activity HflC (stomatin/prohibitin superfamily)
VEDVAKAEETADHDKIEKRLDLGIERYVVPKGFRGVQQEVAGPGIYYLNTRAYIPYIIDTTNITIDWDEVKETQFDALKVISKDGFNISVSVKVIIRVRPDQAPYMVAKIGSIENLVNHVIHPMIDSSFRNQASSTGAMNFLQDRQDEQKKAEDRARTELEKYHVECVSVLICQIKLPQDLMDTQTNKIIAEQRKAMYAEQKLAEEVRITTEKTTAEANLQKTLKEAEIGVMVADQTKKAAILTAEGKGTATKLEQEGIAAGILAVGTAEGSAIRAKGLATAEAYQKQNEAIGKEGVTAIQIATQIATGHVKVVPEMLIQGNGIDGTLSGYLANLMMRGSATTQSAHRKSGELKA